MDIADLFEQVDWISFFVIFAIVISIAILFFRDCSFSFYDPAWFTVGSLSIAVSLVTYLKFSENFGYWPNVQYVCLAFLFFLIGVRATKFIITSFFNKSIRIDFDTDVAGAQFLMLHKILLILIAIISFLILTRAFAQGLPIFAEDPEAAKTAVNSGGFGLITRLLGPSLLLATSITILLITKKRISKTRGFVLIIPVVLSLLSSGSKGSFVLILISFVGVHTYLKYCDVQYTQPRAGWLVFCIAFIIVGYAFLVLILRGSSSDDAVMFAFKTFGIRLLAGGDAVFYFFSLNLHKLISFHPSDYIWDYGIAPVLSIFRLISYQKTLGLHISSELFGVDRGGPNPTLFVEGYSYFGI